MVFSFGMSIFLSAFIPLNVELARSVLAIVVRFGKEMFVTDEQLLKISKLFIVTTASDFSSVRPVQPLNMPRVLRSIYLPSNSFTFLSNLQF